MNNPTTTHTDWIGTTVYDSSADKIGDITDIYLDNVSGQPEWMTVSTGWFGTKEQFIPIAGTSRHEDGLKIGYAEATVKDAPSIDTDQDYLDPDEERRLYAHYGFDYDTTDHAKTFGGRERADDGYSYDDRTEVTLAEEQLAIDKVATEAGRIRLRKYVVTEDVDLTVPVRKQVARIVRTPAEGTGVIDGAETVEEIVLAEEQVVVDKKVVARETVAIETDVVTGTATVSETVRKEQVDIDGEIDNS